MLKYFIKTLDLKYLETSSLKWPIYVEEQVLFINPEIYVRCKTFSSKNETESSNNPFRKNA